MPIIWAVGGQKKDSIAQYKHLWGYDALMREWCIIDLSIF